jgi:hypothetical protein
MRIAVILGLGLALTASAHAATLRGVVTDQASHEPLAGATVVVSSGDVMQTAITEDDGSFTVDVPAGSYLVTYYYGDATVERSDVRVGDGLRDRAAAADRHHAQGDLDWGCDFGPAVPLYTGAPADHADRDPDDVPLLRVLDHLALAGLDARLVPRHAVTTVDGGVRLPGRTADRHRVPGLEVDTASTAAAIASPGATGGALDASLARGSNQHTGGVAALELGPRARFVARHGGPIEEDHVWWSSGVVLDRVSGEDGASGRHGAQLLATLDAQGDPGELALGAAGLATWTPDGGRDLWADAHAGLTADDGKRELRIGLSACSRCRPALLDAAARGATRGPADIDRLAGRLSLTQRGRWHGYHFATVGGELGLGHADEVEHGDLRAFIGDEWLPRPNWTITGGVRWDRRALGPGRGSTRCCRAWRSRGIPARRARGSWFATAERVAALDQDRLGAWRTAAAVGADQASLGYTRDWLDDDVRVTLAARARRAVGVEAAPIERGAEVAVRWLPRRAVRRRADRVVADPAAGGPGQLRSPTTPRRRWPPWPRSASTSTTGAAPWRGRCPPPVGPGLDLRLGARAVRSRRRPTPAAAGSRWPPPGDHRQRRTSTVAGACSASGSITSRGWPMWITRSKPSS